MVGGDAGGCALSKSGMDEPVIGEPVIIVEDRFSSAGDKLMATVGSMFTE